MKQEKYHDEMLTDIIEFLLSCEPGRELTVNDFFNKLYPLPRDRYSRKAAKDRIRRKLRFLELREYIKISDEITELKTIKWRIKCLEKVKELTER
jgi:hypothetical protein